MPRQSTKPPPVAYSYIRFSTPAQAEGDSLRRQTQLAEDYCRRRGWKLDAALTLRDLGVSAFRGDNALVGNLGVFLDAVKRGTVLAGSALIVESVDRISRQGIDEGYDLCKRILKAGVHIVTLCPERDFGPEAVKSLSKGALELQLILERAAEESEMKSRRLLATWEEKRKQARENGHILTHRLPGWVEDRGGKLCLVPERAATLGQICQLAADGYGLHAIVQWLTRAGVPPWNGRGWNRGFLGRLLKDRRALGEYQPYNSERNPTGPPIPDYYPAAVTEAQWLAARAGMAQRRHKQGRTRPGRLNLFAGLLRGAHDGKAYHVMMRQHGVDGSGRRTCAPMLVSAAAINARGPTRSFPMEVFESAILSCLREIDPHEILNGDQGPDETIALADQLAGVEAELADAKAFMDAKGFNVHIGGKIVKLTDRQAEVAALLGEARQRAAHPLSESWGEAQSLAAVLASAPDPVDARLRLRASLRRIVESVWVLVVPRGRSRLAAVQVYFAGKGRRRDYFILHRTAQANAQARVAGGWWCRSLATVAKPDALDLRQRKDAARLERALLAVDVEALGDG
jgi:DNA invertase Pin-like site-specific DNA recombinase